jgi:hypothetical protein
LFTVPELEILKVIKPRSHAQNSNLLLLRNVSPVKTNPNGQDTKY